MAGYRCALCKGYLVQLLSSFEVRFIKARQAYLATITDFESEPFEDFMETKIPQLLPITSSPVSPSDDPYLIVRQAHTLAVMDTESEPEEAPSETEEFQPLAARTTPPSLDYTPTSSNLTPISPLTDEELETSEPSDTRFTSSHSTSSSNSTTPLSPDHPLTQTSLPRPESHTTAVSHVWPCIISQPYPWACQPE
ncbi:hypothetical protein Tco_0994541 [Tanacetum coccineum]